MNGECTELPELLDWGLPIFEREYMELTLNFSSPLSISSSEDKDEIFVKVLNP